MQAQLPHDNVILGAADPALGECIRLTANMCKVGKGALVQRSVEFHGWTVNVIMRARSDGEDPRIQYRIMLRVSFDECPPLSEDLSTQERMIDRFFMVHEHALNVLVLSWKGKPAPFEGLALRLSQVSPTDSWVGHINTSKDGKWRCSHWILVTPEVRNV